MAKLQGLGALLPHEVWRALLATGSARRYDRGEVLVRQGAPGSHVLALTSGNVKVTRTESTGEELLLAVRGPGEVIGEIAVLDSANRSASVIALDTCIVYVVPAARFRHIVNGFHVDGIVLKHIISRFREGEEARAELAELPARQRVAKILLRLANAVGGAQPILQLSQEDLARVSGLSRSAVAAELAALRRIGLVTTGRRRLVICDLNGLSKAAEYV